MRRDRPARERRPVQATDAIRVTTQSPEQETDVDLEMLIVQWSGKLSPGFAPLATPRRDLPPCSQPKCIGTVAIKRDGTPAKSCQRCLELQDIQ